MKRMILLVLACCLAVLPLAACTAVTPPTTTTTTTRTTAGTTTATTAAATLTPTTAAATTTAAAAQTGNMTRYLHGKIDEVTDSGLVLSEVPVYGSCRVKVSPSTQLVGVTELSELEQNLHVIVGYSPDSTAGGMLPGNGEPAEALSEAASQAVTLLPDLQGTPAPTAGPAPSAAELTAVTVELAEPLPSLTGTVGQLNADGFTLEGTSEGTVQVVTDAGTLMEGMDKPAGGELVKVVHNGRTVKLTSARITAISVTKESLSPK